MLLDSVRIDYVIRGSGGHGQQDRHCVATCIQVAEYSFFIFFFICLRSLGSQKPGKAQQGQQLYRYQQPCETLTDDKIRRITWNK